MMTDGLNAINLLLFLALVAGSLAAVCLALLALGLKRLEWAGRIGIVEVAGLVVYGGSLLGASLTSRDHVLARGQEKHICEIDCHLAYSVTGVRRHGDSAFVTLKVRFDSATISPRRGMAPLTPNPRTIAVVDAGGRRYPLASASERLPLARPLIPGQSYEVDLAFDLPAGIRAPRLEVGADDPATRFIIGHENSWLHGKTTFAL